MLIVLNYIQENFNLVKKKKLYNEYKKLKNAVN